MWFNEQRNRRRHRNQVLDVKVRSDLVRADRARLVTVSLLSAVGTLFGLYLLWCVGNWGLNLFVYRNPDFAIRRVDIRTDGALTPDQLRQWAGVRPGANLIALDLAEVKHNLEQFPVIRSVSVERVLPNTLKIQVTERRAVAQAEFPYTAADGSVTIQVFQLDAEGIVMPPAPGRPGLARTLPVITGENALSLRLGRRADSPGVLAALRLVAAFQTSPMAGLAVLRYVDVATPGVLLAVTEQGSRITFGLDDPARQLRRWWQIDNYGRSRQETVASADLAVANNVPVHYLALAGSLPVPAPVVKPAKPSKNRRKNV